ncbi:auxin-responsive protein IAA9-like [Papaver somniferum]|uniref:auxin-responsive protein IAA9-like n=1 Tax=Papaver somniferum TaxID=3469 RepID=UPI000E6FE83B|nr:auxin-responsive protein IAA9-like [Papaver somniferum]
MGVLFVEEESKVGNEKDKKESFVRAQAVGWLPIRSFRKNTLASTTKTSEEVDGKPGSSALYVKISMDGQCGPHGAPGRENKHMDFLHGSEYVLAYEDKDGDWKQVGDVPWECVAVVKKMNHGDVSADDYETGRGYARFRDS